MTDRIAPAENPPGPTENPAPAVPPPGRGSTAPATGIVLEDGPAPAAPADVWAAPGLAHGPFGPTETDEQRLQRIRRRRRTLVRRGAAGLVLLIAGTASAYAVTAPDRTDIPGLATPKDGRYTFPVLALPPLPSGKPAPGAPGAELRHEADLRRLVLPAPEEAIGAAAVSASPTAPPSATASPATPAASPAAVPAGTAPAQWAVCEDLAAELAEAETLKSDLMANACRAGVVREWTAKDGTKTRIRLLRFGSRAEASNVSNSLWLTSELKGVGKLELEKDAKGLPTTIGVGAQLRHNGDEKTGKPDTTRAGYLLAGDVLGLIVMTNPAGVPLPAFHQVVLLQSDLLA
ncbi:hypothetical protein GCM10010495_07580 [Kitasatospora herbaricolor]|uniref:hypothetical protein n=1 Tax=Kitasatospora herbaricolor TaxID=68217 RepID=UPI00174C3E1D|nr:hypothetical protein [Kitasatospora herbaricolor]MDQ0309804.1 hypothetical protein [Kitasatospora herbaricolor]GGU99483.1 hypothetical protein GCM10010495_07580 [Kitasatospora herbaricolor]